MSMNNGITLFLSLFFFYLPKLLDAYDPVDRFSINCGSSGNFSDGDRTWTGDINSKLLSSSPSSTPVVAPASTQSSSTNQPPYTTARLSTSQFTYSFPVTQGPKFLRLFFYPSSYSNFHRANALFAVHSGEFTLLKDFNASLTADADADADAGEKGYIFKEYIVNVDDGQWLNLTFTPNTSSFPNSYAFVNGIEVVSMPFDLYYNSSIPNQGFTFVGTTQPFSLSNNTALETDYRIRVGGETTIMANGDTGLLRKWDGNDYDYLNPKSSYTSLNYLNPKLDFSIIPNYTAPEELYRRGREMGLNATFNKISNMTWEFLVDVGFTYMLRLHFCELSKNMTDPGDRVFIIYIAQQVAEERADVLRWTKQKGVPIYKDYAVHVSGNQKRANISLQLHPFSGNRDTKYSDPFLNGLEIFKISDPGTKNLAGPNPDPIQVPVQQNPVQDLKRTNSSGTTIIGVVAGVISGVILISIIAFFVFKHKRETKKAKDSRSTTDGTSKWGFLSFSTTKTSKTSNSSLPSNLCRQFTLVEIKTATNNFDDVFIIGVGGFGHVYKGYINDGQTPVAIKRLKQGSQQGAHEFMNEIHMLSQLRHLHLVSLIGYCNENNEMILVYDFMTRGTLRDHLYNTDNPALPWKQRLRICIGAARGLHYLHTGSKHTIIHRDVKTTNILIDEKWVAKVSDFGLSRIGPTTMSKAHVSTVVKGSLGYLDPEYYKRQHLTEKSDVYSFGVVLFEVLCARPPLIRTTEKRQVSLADWARQCWESGTLAQIVDPTLKGKIAPECLRKFGEIGVSCLLDNGTQRPSMNDIVWMLEFALQMQESAEARDQHIIGVRVVAGNDGDEVGRKDESDDMFSSGTSVGHVSGFNKSSEVSVTSSSTGEHSYNKESDRLFMSGTVFSEIMDPKAR
ncbi:hypothetical protein RIF29_19237 [Crotalaria pallida]|uniref:Protein kinase domain-containing protein n=1 Tax=Crotalaria pallida TaxID=3830 RepID=A0AAN9I3Z1_CROPI